MKNNLSDITLKKSHRFFLHNAFSYYQSKYIRFEESVVCQFIFSVDQCVTSRIGTDRRVKHRSGIVGS